MLQNPEGVCHDLKSGQTQRCVRFGRCMKRSCDCLITNIKRSQWTHDSDVPLAFVEYMKYRSICRRCTVTGALHILIIPLLLSLLYISDHSEVVFLFSPTCALVGRPPQSLKERHSIWAATLCWPRHFAFFWSVYPVLVIVQWRCKRCRGIISCG